MVPLLDLQEGDIGEVAEISDKNNQLERHHQQENCRCRNHRIKDLGLRVGKVVKLMRKQRGGPLLIKVDESRIAIGRGIAERIKIKNLH